MLLIDPLPPRSTRQLREWAFTARQRVDEARAHYENYLREIAIPNQIVDSSSNVSGNYLYACENVVESFECSNSSGLIHCYLLEGASNCLEGFGFGGDVQNSAQFVSVGRGARNIINSIQCWNNVSNLTYCSHCEDSSNLFGCVGLRGQEYCIFNKQYSETEYNKLCGKIKSLMKEIDLWGQFFPVAFSGYPYNLSAAYDYMALNQVQTTMMRFAWDETDNRLRPSQLLASAEDKPEEHYAEMPHRLDELGTEELISSTYLCEITGKPFQLMREEIELYEKLGVALPSHSFESRAREKLSRLSPKYLRARRSDISGNFLKSAFPEKWRQPVYSQEEWEKCRGTELP